ncbi:hypothetical protein QYE76_064681 [Lolium multiflorum]|uniref:Uncharacterized protein n=1 Tax=Lolium multiflorum TaxID=4521 RepID=A0AAD8W7Y7_LOLMU|nr:hypothetical protein QYE76_064681 [Lolium multiflorum]
MLSSGPVRIWQRLTVVLRMHILLSFWRDVYRESSEEVLRNFDSEHGEQQRMADNGWMYTGRVSATNKTDEWIRKTWHLVKELAHGTKQKIDFDEHERDRGEVMRQRLNGNEYDGVRDFLDDLVDAHMPSRHLHGRNRQNRRNLEPEEPEPAKAFYDMIAAAKTPLYDGAEISARCHLPMSSRQDPVQHHRDGRSKSENNCCWPVFVIPLNLPPESNDEEDHVLAIIPGPHYPGKNLSVYMQPIVEDLNHSWHHGTLTYDRASKTNFCMKVWLRYTMHDMPGYALTCGWCQLYLKRRHPFREDKKNFKKGKVVHEVTEVPKFDGIAVDAELRALVPAASEAGHQFEGYGVTHNWTHEAALTKLEYYKDLELPHNIDVMHTVKNVAESLFHTCLNIPGKSKDNVKARVDVEKLCDRKKLHMQRPTGRRKNWFKPHADFCLDSIQKKEAFKCLKYVKAALNGWEVVFQVSPHGNLPIPSEDDYNNIDPVTYEGIFYQEEEDFGHFELECVLEEDLGNDAETRGESVVDLKDIDMLEKLQVEDDSDDEPPPVYQDPTYYSKDSDSDSGKEKQNEIDDEIDDGW